MNKEIKVHDYFYDFNLIIMKSHFPEILPVSLGSINNNPKEVSLPLFVSWIAHYGKVISYLFSPLKVNDGFLRSTPGALKPKQFPLLHRRASAPHVFCLACPFFSTSVPHSAPLLREAALALVASQNLNCLRALVPAVSSTYDTWCPGNYDSSFRLLFKYHFQSRWAGPGEKCMPTMLAIWAWSLEIDVRVGGENQLHRP